LPASIAAEVPKSPLRWCHAGGVFAALPATTAALGCALVGTDSSISAIGTEAFMAMIEAAVREFLI
jgi:hypothetical protein